MILGGGRETKDSIIDLSAGIRLKKKKGDFTEATDSIAVIYANDEKKARDAEERIRKAYTISSEPPEKTVMIKGFCHE